MRFSTGTRTKQGMPKSSASNIFDPASQETWLGLPTCIGFGFAPRRSSSLVISSCPPFAASISADQPSPSHSSRSAPAACSSPTRVRSPRCAAVRSSHRRSPSSSFAIPHRVWGWSALVKSGTTATANASAKPGRSSARRLAFASSSRGNELARKARKSLAGENT